MTVIEERNVVNDVVAVIEASAEDITLDLDSEELHYLCQETNRPTLGVNWDYLGWIRVRVRVNNQFPSDM